MKNSVLETLVGAIVLVAAAGFLAFAWQRTQINVDDGYTLTAKFSRIGGLDVGDDVRISGINVGKVTGQKLDPETFEAVVSLRIRKDVDIPGESTARIAMNGLLGGNHITIEPGGALDIMADGDEIEFTAEPVDLDQAIGRLIFGGAEDDEDHDKDKDKASSNGP